MEPKEDCTFCRLSGGAVGLGVGGFSLRKAMELQRKVGTSNKAVALGVTGVCKLSKKKLSLLTNDRV